MNILLEFLKHGFYESVFFFPMSPLPRCTSGGAGGSGAVRPDANCNAQDPDHLLQASMTKNIFQAETSLNLTAPESSASTPPSGTSMVSAVGSRVWYVGSTNTIGEYLTPSRARQQDRSGYIVQSAKYSEHIQHRCIITQVMCWSESPIAGDGNSEVRLEV